MHVYVSVGGAGQSQKDRQQRHRLQYWHGVSADFCVPSRPDFTFGHVEVDFPRRLPLMRWGVFHLVPARRFLA